MTFDWLWTISLRESKAAAPNSSPSQFQTIPNAKPLYINIARCAPWIMNYDARRTLEALGDIALNNPLEWSANREALDRLSFRYQKLRLSRTR